MKILSFGAGMQSTALALMACENAVKSPELYPAVPVYDAVIFCDLGLEPPWVMRQGNDPTLAAEAPTGHLLGQSGARDKTSFKEETPWERNISIAVAGSTRS